MDKTAHDLLNDNGFIHELSKRLQKYFGPKPPNGQGVPITTAVTYYVSDTSGGATDKKLTLTYVNGYLTSATLE